MQTIRRKLWIIVPIALLFGASAVGYSMLQQPQYQASIKILVGQDRGLVETPADVIYMQELTQTMVEAANSRPIAEDVIDQLNMRITPEAFLDGQRLSVQPIPDTQFIEVTYRDPDPEQAQRVANAVGEVFSQRISDIGPSSSAISVTVWERAAVPAAPVSPDPVRDGVLALILGLMLGVGVALLVEHLDDSWRSAEEIEQITGALTVGIIPELKSPKHVGNKG